MEAFLPKHRPLIPPLKLSFRAFCGGVRVGGFSSDRWSGVRAGGPANPCPPSQSLCSTPQRKCQVWPQEGAHRSQDKEIFRLSSSPPPPFATHHNDRCALPVQQNATKCIGRGGGLSHSGATRQMSQFFAAGVESAKQQLVREVGCGKIQLSQVSLIHKEGLLLTLAGGALTG